MYSRDSSVPLLTAFVAPVGMTTAHHVTRAERQRSRGVLSLPFFLKKEFSDRIYRMEQDNELMIFLYPETRKLINTAALAR